MIPMIQLRLPKLSSSLKKELIEIAGTIGDEISRNTIGEREYNAKQTNNVKVLSELQELKDLYGFDHLPQHRGKRLDSIVTDRIRKELHIPFPYKSDFVIQVISTKDTFIHNDGSRKCSLYYMITDDSATTSFYESVVNPICGTVWSPNDVTKTHTFTMKQDDWHLFNHQAIHSVNEVNKTRIGMLIDMSRVFDSYEQCAKEFERYYAKTV